MSTEIKPGKICMDCFGAISDYRYKKHGESSLALFQDGYTFEDEIVEYGPGIDTTRNKNGLKASSWDYTKNNLQQLVRNGNTAGVDKYMSQITPQLSEEQFNEAIKIIERKN